MKKSSVGALLVAAAAFGQSTVIVQPTPAKSDSVEFEVGPPGELREGILDGEPITYEVRDGLAFWHGDILLGAVEELEGSAKGSHREASVIRSGNLWPNGIVFYEVEPGDDLAAKVRDAIQHWETNSRFRFVPRTDQPNYVVFTARDSTSCFSSLGMTGRLQIVNLASRGCDAAAAVHEIGHVLGLRHEQARNDRDQFITVLYDNIQRGRESQFNMNFGGIGRDVGYYDYGSIMHYSRTAFAADPSRPTITSIPEGIPFGQRSALSPGDIISAELLYGFPLEAFVVHTNPAGLEVIVDGSPCRTPCRFAWPEGSQHSVEVAPQQQRTAGGLTYYFARWSDAGDRLHQITASSQFPVITANYSSVRPVDFSTGAVRPDLAIQTFYVPSRAAIGERLTGVRVEVVNLGQADAPAFRVGFYISPDPDVTPSDTFTGWSCEAPEGLAVSATLSCTGDIGLPASLQSGIYHIGAIVDDRGQVTESREDNNVRTSDNGAFTLAAEPARPLPDLVVTFLEAPATAIAGGRLPSVGVAILNQGPSISSRFRLGFYLSADSVITADDTFTGWYCEFAGLREGAATSCGGQVGLPASLSPGSYFFGAVVDDQGTIAESNEANNGRSADTGGLVIR